MSDTKRKRGREKGCVPSNKFKWTEELRQVAANATAMGMNQERIAGIVGCSYKTYQRELERDENFRVLIEKTKGKLEYRARKTSFEDAFPTDPKKKPDVALRIFLLKTMFGMRENPDAKEIVAAIAPLIQFGQKEPPRDASSVAPEARTYFDAPKEIEAS